MKREISRARRSLTPGTLRGEDAHFLLEAGEIYPEERQRRLSASDSSRMRFEVRMT